MNFRWYGLGLVAAGGCAIVACSSGSGGASTPSTDGGSTPDGGTVSDSGGSSDSGRGTDGALGDDGGGTSGDASPISCGSPDAAGLPYTGVVELSRVMMAPAAPRFEAIGQFETAASAPPTGGCSGMMMGACCLETTAGAMPVAASPGTVTISDGTNTLGTLSPPVYAATSAATASFTWMPGATLKITSSGATIDAFTATVVAPGLLTGVTPSFSASIPVSLHSDLVVSWTAATRPCLEISFGLTQGSGMPHIGCVAADSAGTLTVPAALLGMFTASTGTAVIERVVGKHVLTGNAGIGIAVVDVIQTTTTYTP